MWAHIAEGGPFSLWPSEAVPLRGDQGRCLDLWRCSRMSRECRGWSEPLSAASRKPAEARPFVRQLIAGETDFRLASEEFVPSTQRLYSALAADGRRNTLILDDVIRSLHEGRSPILLTERRDHLDYLAARLEKFARNLIVLRSGMSVVEQRQVTERLAAIPEREERLVLATGRYIGEGFDDARLTRSSLPSPYLGRGRSSSTPVVSTVLIPQRQRCGSSTTSIAAFPCSNACSRGGCGGTEPSATRGTRRRWASARRPPISSSSTTRRLSRPSRVRDDFT